MIAVRSDVMALDAIEVVQVALGGCEPEDVRGLS
jgi:hypothetical protein